MTTIGIDPGSSGAISVLLPDRTVFVWDCPSYKIKVGGTLRRRCDQPAIIDLVRYLLAVHEPDKAVIEDVGAMPGNSGMFAFGFATGMWHMAFTACGYPLQMVTPKVWKGALGVPTKKKTFTERDVLARATVLLPKGEPHWPRVMDCDRAEAAMIALYASGRWGS